MIKYGWSAETKAPAPHPSPGTDLPVDRLLTDLRATLDRLGYVVVPHGDHLCMRLPLAVSIRIYSTDGRVRFVPRFGPFGRTTALIGTSAIATGTVAAAAFAIGVAPLTLIAGFVGVLAIAHDACRFVLTEGSVTRLQQLVLDLQRETPPHALASSSPLPNEIGPGRGVEVGAPPTRRVTVPAGRPGQE
jgi:hypothetical protein